jgi:hypothetical protein
MEFKTKMIRITADIDNTPLSVVETRTHLVQLYCFDKDIIFDRKTIRKSSSGRGYHVILWTSNTVDRDLILFIRYLLGDDTKRIMRDVARRKPKQYLFKEKIRK